MKVIGKFAIYVLLFMLTGLLSWRAGWNAHSVYVNAMAASKKAKAEDMIRSSEVKAARTSNEGRIVYHVINRDVIKYVQSPNRTVCKFDNDAVRLRQRAIDAANSLSGFDGAPMQSK
ncbi:hypothetical protein SMX15_000004 [Cronobacter sakazakii]|nr:hypothetical protein [Cronobacter sakazakii]ELY2620413.1 hypothetical protein [Cronobacter malonaticus]EIZ8991302.1 hypothetical protein [Cronobacter sakazakii]EKK3979566.1 hypothetical protein [Cronobacter sakazakii]ELY3537518.1 hypothetical protein [Cronobacter sakazakii]